MATEKVLWLLPVTMALCMPLHARNYSVNVRFRSVVPEYTFNMGIGKAPSGNCITVSSTGLLMNGQSILPVMGEFHYTRYPASEWKRELLKMKAGGISIVATYVFWIHHEEQEGVYDWNGCRNLRAFIQACKDAGLQVVLRLGPWCHGETRNGGFPEWLLKRHLRLRSDDPAYLKEVRTWFSQIYRQVEGMMWKDGGPVIGVQLENEFKGRGEHLMTLKTMVRELGFDVPLYTRTGWPKLATPVPYGEILPLYGDYADGFWDRSLKEMPGDYAKSFIFRSFRNSTVIATEQLPEQSDKDNPDDNGYPYFTCELGGGMVTSYHRRIIINPMDVYSMSLVRVGSGSNMPGYYVYHSGTNPDGRFTTLNESQASSYTNHNDLPVKSYEYQSPLGEFGQLAPHYHLLRRFHLFLQDFGNRLAGMKPFFPQDMETDFHRDSLLRWSVRSDGNSGFVFINNYQRLRQLTPKRDITFTIQTRNGDLTFPKHPMTVESSTCFLMPFNLNMEGITLRYATAQPVSRIENGSNTVYVFASNKGITPEFSFSNNNIQSILTGSAQPHRLKDGTLLFSRVRTGYGTAIRLLTKKGRTVSIVLLDEASSLSLWKGNLAGRERLFITANGLTIDGNTLELACENNRKPMVAVYPASGKISQNETPLKGQRAGIFTVYNPVTEKITPLKVGCQLLQQASIPMRAVQFSKAKLPMQPKEADFTKAAVWKLNLPDNAPENTDYRLSIHYTGDVARIYSDGRLIADNFYNGKSFQLGVKRFMPGIRDKELLLKILPLQKSIPMYLPVKGVERIKDGTASVKDISVTWTTYYRLMAE